MARPPLPPFTLETAKQKVPAAEDGWNTRDPEKVALAYTEDSQWRNRDLFITGRPAIIEFLTAKWGARARLRPPEGTLGLSGEPDGRPIPVRMA